MQCANYTHGWYLPALVVGLVAAFCIVILFFVWRGWKQWKLNKARTAAYEEASGTAWHSVLQVARISSLRRAAEQQPKPFACQQAVAGALL